MNGEGEDAAGQARPPERWASRWARHPLGPALLVLFSALEACLFPAPTEALMVALALARPGRSWRLAALAVLGSLAGALIGYGIGRYGLAALDWAGGDAASPQHLETLGRAYRGGAFWLLATSGFTPIPYFLYTIAAGVYRVPLLPFLAGALTGRALKYLFLGSLTYSLGPLLHRLLARPRLLAAAACVLVVLGALGWALST